MSESKRQPSASLSLIRGDIDRSLCHLTCLLLSKDDGLPALGFFIPTMSGTIECIYNIEDPVVPSPTWPDQADYYVTPLATLMEAARSSLDRVMPRAVAVFTSALTFNPDSLSPAAREYYDQQDPLPLAELTLSANFTETGELDGDLSLYINQREEVETYPNLEGAQDIPSFVAAYLERMAEKAKAS